jgi:hypothetical protein
LEQTISVYEARTEQDLTLIDQNLSKIQGLLSQYRKNLDARDLKRKAAMLVSAVAVVMLFVLVILGPRHGLSVNTVIPILALPLPVVLWSTIGSFTAILYRFNNSPLIELQDPLRWLFTRPLTGVMMGAITYLVISVGLITISPGRNTPIGSKELIWLIAFLAGFSDRFADAMLKSLVGRFGGDKNSELVSIEADSTSTLLPSLSTIIDGMEKFITKINPSPAKRETQDEALIPNSSGPISNDGKVSPVDEGRRRPKHERRNRASSDSSRSHTTNGSSAVVANPETNESDRASDSDVE